MNFYLDINTSKPNAIAFAQKLCDYIYELGYSIVLEKEFSKDTVILSIGGDGTLINTWQKYFSYELPIFGINCGHLGYLVEGTTENYKQKILNIVNGNYSIESRLCLQGHIVGQDNTYIAVNEFAFNRVEGLFKYSISIDKQLMQYNSGDGLICATPTGSTAYALSAGGACIEPTLDVVELTPVCPHSLMNRSIILPVDRTISISADSKGLITADGIHKIEIKEGETFEISRFYPELKLIRVDKESFIDKIANTF